MPTYLQLPISGTLGDAIRPENIYTVCEVAPRSNGYDLGYICCNQHGKTNMWARFKPEAIGGPAPITEAQRKANNYGLTRSDGDNMSYAPSMPSVNNLAAVTWTYTPPSALQWHRITDWDGYEHRAVEPMSPPGDLDWAYEKTELVISLQNTQIMTVRNLRVDDFGYAAGKYLCAILWYRNKSTNATTLLNYRTANATIDSSAGTDDKHKIKISRNEMPSNSNYEFHYLLCLSTTKRTESWTTSPQMPSTSLFPLVCSSAPTGIITMLSTASVKFQAESIGRDVPKGHPVAGTLNYFSMPEVDQTTNQLTYHCLGTGSAGNVTLCGYFYNDSGSLATINSATLLQVALKPSLSSNLGETVTGVPKVYTKPSSSSTKYSEAVFPISVANGASVYVALEFVGIAKRKADGSTGNPVRTYQLNASLRLNYLKAGTSSDPASLFGGSFNICTEGNQDIVVEHSQIN